MIDYLPTYISISFVLTTLTTLLLFVWVIKNSTDSSTQKKVVPIAVGLTVWLSIQAILAFNNCYNTNLNQFPPRIMVMGILPTLLSITLLFVTPKGRAFVDSLPLKNLTYLNIVRIPVEIILFWLFLNKTIPEIMTFEGNNFDILAGITAPFVAYFGFVKMKMNSNFILTWNFISLLLLVHIIVLAVLSAPSPVQQIAFEQPNIAILNFPFNWLPTFIVPIIVFGHLTSMRQLINANKFSK